MPTTSRELVVARFLVADRDNPSSIASAVMTARENLRTTRATVPRDEHASVPVRILLDTDPMFTQIQYAEAGEGFTPGGSGIRALVAGHTHLPWPLPGDSGLVAGTPVVLPGFGGTHLGVIDLTLERRGAEPWRIACAAARLEPATAAPVPERLMRSLAPAQRLALRAQSRRVGRCRRGPGEAPISGDTSAVGPGGVAVHGVFGVADRLQSHGRVVGPLVIGKVLEDAALERLAVIAVGGDVWLGDGVS